MTAGGERLDARAIGLAVFAMAILGGSYTAGKLALQDLPVFGMLAARMAVTTLTLGVYAYWARVPLWQKGPAVGYILAQTGFFVLTQTLLFFALMVTSAGRVAILFNMQPFFTLMLLPLLVPAERLTRVRWLGTGVAFVGVALVLAERGTAGGSLLADLMVLLAALGWTANIVLNKKMPRDINAVSVIFWNCAAAIPVFGLLTLALEAPEAWNLSAAALGSVLYLGVVAAGLGFVLVVWLTRTYSASRVNVFVFLSPVFGVLIGWAALGETVSTMQALGALAVAAPTVRGMLWMAATGVLFTLLNSTMKKLSHELDPWLVGFLRYLLGALVILAPALRLGMRELWPKAPKLQFIRGSLHAGGMLLWFAALPTVAIAEITAIGFAGPIFICLGAVLFLNERMTGARWAAVLVGFSGVLLVLNPFGAGGFSGISAGMLMMLASGPLFAASFLVAKVLTRHDRSDVMVLWQHLVVSMLLLPFGVFLWAMPSPAQWALLLVCGFLGAGGHYCMTRAFRVADISAVQSVKFLELLWAALLGYVMFSTTPGGWTLVGGAVILASTLWLARQESR